MPYDKDLGKPNLSGGNQKSQYAGPTFTVEDYSIEEPQQLRYVVGTYAPSSYFGDNNYTKVIYGPGVGVAESYSYDANDQYVFGGKGAGIAVKDTAGEETIVIKHPTGGFVYIDADGSVHLRGLGKGLTFSTPAGDIGFDGQTVLVTAKSALKLECTGGDVDIIGENINLKTTGEIKQTAYAMDSTISGKYSQQIVGNRVETIGGHSRTTIAGDERTQITGSVVYDVGGTSKTRIEGATEINIDDTFDLYASGDSSIQINTSDFKLLVTGNIDIETQSNFRLLAEATMAFASVSNATMSTEAALTITSQSNANITTKSAMNIGATNNMNMDAAEIHAQEDIVSPITPIDVALQSITYNQFAEYASANAIIDAMTTQRVYPGLINGLLHAASFEEEVEGQPEEGPTVKDVTDQNQGSPGGVSVGPGDMFGSEYVIEPKSSFGEDPIKYSEAKMLQEEILKDLKLIEAEMKKRGLL